MRLPRLLRSIEKFRKYGNQPAGIKRGLPTLHPTSEALESVGSGGWI
jgi:hypothetical protein